MNVTHCVSGLNANAGGPSRSVPSLVQALARNGMDVSIAYVSNGSLSEPAAASMQLVQAHDPSGLRVLGASRSLRRALLADAEVDLLHAHGLWELPAHYVASAGRRLSVPYVITPRGMLESWALRRSRWKKRLVGWLYQNRDLRRSDCLHAITPSEVHSFRAYGLTNPIAVVPNGVDLAEFANLHNMRGRLAEMFPAARDRRVALFLSRLHPKKGLLHLMDAWARVRADYRDWLLLICGPDDVGHRAEVERKAADLGITQSVALTGPMYGEDKLAAFAAADLFALPSFSEGFSMALLEALASRLPVLITPGCNFPEVAEWNAGVIVRPNAEGAEDGLRRLMAMTQSERHIMGARGRAMVEANYTWDKVAAQIIEVYEWLLGGREQPECVVSAT